MCQCSCLLCAVGGCGEWHARSLGGIMAAALTPAAPIRILITEQFHQ